MEIYQDFYDFLIESQQNFFIDVEAKKNQMTKFIKSHNELYNRNVEIPSQGVCLLGDVDKWGKQLRVYFHNKENVPSGLHVQNNNKFRNPNYEYRLDDNKLVEFLFSKGCVIGLNRIRHEY